MFNDLGDHYDANLAPEASSRHTNQERRLSHTLHDGIQVLLIHLKAFKIFNHLACHELPA